jgi:muconolactone delta-isomerase
MRFMVVCNFTPSPEIPALIPAERARVKELMDEGKMETLYIAADQSKVWLVMQGANQAEVEEAVASLPLHRFMTAEFVGLG